MARPIRVEFPDAYYWISNITNAGAETFSSGKLCKIFMRTLEECVVHFKTTLYAFSVSPSGYSLFIKTPLNNLTESIGWLQTTSTIRINRALKINGHVFAGRYKAVLVSPGQFARALICRIHLEPFTQSGSLFLVKGVEKKLSNYPYSSHLSYYREYENLEFVTYDFLTQFTDINNSKKVDYKSSIQAICSEKEIPDLRAKIRSSLVLGDDDLLERVQNEIMQKSSGLMESKWLRSEQSRARTEQIAREIPENIDRDTRIWLLAKVAGERPTELARKFGFADAGAITHLIHKIKRKQENSPILAKQIASMTNALNRGEKIATGSAFTNKRGIEGKRPRQFSNKKIPSSTLSTQDGPSIAVIEESDEGLPAALL